MANLPNVTQLLSAINADHDQIQRRAESVLEAVTELQHALDQAQSSVLALRDVTRSAGL
jgi:cell division septum initiation protein DivIVA